MHIVSYALAMAHLHGNFWSTDPIEWVLFDRDFIAIQVPFIDAWHQNRKPRENYFWMNNIYLYVGSSFCELLWGLSQNGYGLNNLTNICMYSMDS